MSPRILVLVGLLALGLPSGALAQGDPVAPLPQAPSTQPPVVTQPSPDAGGGLEGWQQALIFAAGGLLLAGIGAAIVRDARRAAPVKPRGSDPAPAAPRGDRARRARARAKAARRQRRRNR